MKYLISIVIVIVLVSGCTTTIDRVYCEERGEVCITQYDPVCGHFDETIRCVTAPCGATYSNGCVACSDEKVEFYTKGECKTI
tara:strand:+ start:1023 stop:1271 length:249 start_codon:yes stop_codon:yes gene_type:complete